MDGRKCPQVDLENRGEAGLEQNKTQLKSRIYGYQASIPKAEWIG